MKKIDLTGKIFGRLTVVKESLKKKRNRPSWDCLCDCLNKINVAGCELRSGETKSCGCLRKDLLTQDLKGIKFNLLTVIEKSKKRGKSSSQFWNCICECGNYHIVSAQHLNMGSVKSCGCWLENNIDNETKERFFKFVEKNKSCWNWKGRISKGYGIFNHSKLITAHRFSYILHNGNIPDKKIICHTCDNPKCVNPKHLYAGTHKDNTNDMLERGRARKPKSLKDK
jgi:hypothetical protein